MGVFVVLLETGIDKKRLNISKFYYKLQSKIQLTELIV